MKVKLFTALLSLIGSGLLFVALQIKAPFSYDPLGPRFVPVAVSAILMILPLWIAFNPKSKSGEFAIGKNAVQLVGILCFYFISFKFLGFILSTIISCYLITRIIGCSRMQGLLTGLIISLIFYGVFRLMLGASLPLGRIFEFIG